MDHIDSNTPSRAEQLAALDFAGREINRHAQRAGDAIAARELLEQRLRELVNEWNTLAGVGELVPDAEAARTYRIAAARLAAIVPWPRCREIVNGKPCGGAAERDGLCQACWIDDDVQLDRDVERVAEIERQFASSSSPAWGFRDESRADGAALVVSITGWTIIRTNRAIDAHLAEQRNRGAGGDV